MSIEVNVYKAEEEIESLLTSNPRAAKAFDKAIRKLLQRTARDVRRANAAAIGNDPRKAARAVKTAVYKRILGGAVSILDKKRASGTRARLVRARKLDSNPHQRGGNRMQRSQRTEDMETYFGSDRAFVLRFLNSGADRTNAGAMRSRSGSHLKAPANRGIITARNFFDAATTRAMEANMAQFEEDFRNELKDILE